MVKDEEEMKKEWVEGKGKRDKTREMNAKGKKRIMKGEASCIKDISGTTTSD